VNTLVSTPPPTVSAGDRLSLTLFFSVVLHGIIILGVVFTHADPTKVNTNPTLEIILAQTSSTKKPEKADYLAQASQDGSGNINKRVRPTQPRAAALSMPSPGQSDVMSLPHAATPQNAQTMEVLTTSQATDQSVDVNKVQPEHQSDLPSAAELMMRSKEIAKLTADLSDSLQAYSHRPRQRYISASTQSYRDAAYLEAWRSKIERIGNLNYPEEAKRENLSGSLILDVAINADGTVHSIELRRSSGYKLLDDAAIRIVRLAAPFAPLSKEMRKDTDILHITRTWQFLDDNSFSSGV
jgi:periplasmic protein TonB